MNCSGDCFVVVPPEGIEQPLIIGRNAIGGGELLGVATEVCLYEAKDALAGKSEINPPDNTFSIILQKPRPRVWGGDFGANERNVVISITWSKSVEDGDGDGNVLPTDILRIVLASSNTAELAIEKIGTLVNEQARENFRANYLICDTKEAWLMSCASKFWAAVKLNNGSHRISCNGLTVGTKIDKCSENVKDLSDKDFASNFNNVAAEVDWEGPKHVDDGLFGLINMFKVLRSAVDPKTARSSCVSVLNKEGISNHWFTATPNAAESVFKPFVFSLHPKISPLTMISRDSDATLLHTLHTQRKPTALDNLKALEAACVEEVNTYISEHSVPDEELDELMKDCVEAEVKFYR